MSAFDNRVSWVALLALMVVVTVACTAAYVLVPSSDAAPHVPAVPAAHRIAASDSDGALVVVDDRTGEVSEPVDPGLGPVDVIDLIDRGRKAVVSTQAGAIEVVALRTAKHRAVGRGRPAAVGRIFFPQLAASVERPAADQLATVPPGDVPRLRVRNLVTGEARTLGSMDPDDPPWRTTGALTWSAFANVVHGIADDGRTLFRIDVDRARSLDEATVRIASPAPWLDLATFEDGLVALRGEGDDTELVRIDGRSLDPEPEPLEVPAPFVSIDSDLAAARLVAVTDSGALWTLAVGADRWQHLADGIESASI